MFFLGLATTVVGAAARNIGLSPSQIGLMLSVQNVGFILTVFLSGALSDSHEKPKILLVGSLVLAASLLAFYASGMFWLSLVAMLLMGAGIGTYEGVTDAMLFDLHKGRESLHVNINHFFVTFGAVTITVYLIFLQMNWRYAIIQSAIVVLLLAAFFVLAKLESQGKKQENYRERFKVLSREKVVVVLFLCIALAVGVELGTIGLLTTFLMEFRGFSQVTSKIGLVVFLSGIFTGRLLMGFIAKSQRIWQYVLALFGLSLLSFTSLYFLDLEAFTYLPIYLAGASMSALLPLMLTLAGLKYQETAGTVLGLVKMAIGVGGILTPLALSIVAKYCSEPLKLDRSSQRY